MAKTLAKTKGNEGLRWAAPRTTPHRLPLLRGLLWCGLLCSFSFLASKYLSHRTTLAELKLHLQALALSPPSGPAKEKEGHTGALEQSWARLKRSLENEAELLLRAPASEVIPVVQFSQIQPSGGLADGVPPELLERIRRRGVVIIKGVVEASQARSLSLFLSVCLSVCLS